MDISKMKMGCLKDDFDHRDNNLKFPFLKSILLPKKFNLISFMPEVWDQGNLGSCTAHGVNALMEYVKIRQKKPSFKPSMLYTYYNTRKLANNTSEDSGASIRDCVKSVVNDGICGDTLWPYIENKFSTKPPDNCYTEGEKNQALIYSRVQQNLTQFKTSLVSGLPIIFGFICFSSLMNDTTTQTGMIPMPKKGEEQLGGHCVLAVGFDDSKQSFIIRNSWGSIWGNVEGNKGYGYLPYNYMCNPQLAWDFWTIKNVE